MNCYKTTARIEKSIVLKIPSKTLTSEIKWKVIFLFADSKIYFFLTKKYCWKTVGGLSLALHLHANLCEDG